MRRRAVETAVLWKEVRDDGMWGTLDAQILGQCIYPNRGCHAQKLAAR